MVSWLFSKANAPPANPHLCSIPLIELATGSCLWPAGGALVHSQPLWPGGFVAGLVAASAIDWDTTLLPDSLTLPPALGRLAVAPLGWKQHRTERRPLGAPSRATCRCGRCTGLFKTHHRQRRNGVWGLQAARSVGCLAWLEHDPADRAGLIPHRCRCWDWHESSQAMREGRFHPPTAQIWLAFCCRREQVSMSAGLGLKPHPTASPTHRID